MTQREGRYVELLVSDGPVVICRDCSDRIALAFMLPGDEVRIHERDHQVEDDAKADKRADEERDQRLADDREAQL